MQYPALNIVVRRRLDDMSARSFSLPDVAAALDGAAKEIQNRLGLLTNITSLSLVANQRRYAVASTVQNPIEIQFYDGDVGKRVEGRSSATFRDLSRSIERATVPRDYTWNETERAIYVNPIPDTAAGTTQINAVGGISATATSVTVDSTSGFPSEGRVIIDSEVMTYTNKTSTTLTGLTRGAEGTTAATHADDATVRERDLIIHAARLWKDFEMNTFYTTGTVSITTATTALTGSSTVWNTGNTHGGDYFAITTDTTPFVRVLPLKWYKITSVDSATAITLADTFDEPTASAAAYIIGSPNPFPNYADEALIALAMSPLLRKAGNEPAARAMFAKGEAFIQSVSSGHIDYGAIRVPQPIASQEGRMAAWSGTRRV